MSFLVSPGVQVQEKDLSNVVPAVATSIGAFAGPFRWGPTGTAITCATEGDLLTNFGKPDSTNAVSFLTAASFLKYGNTLKVSRAINSSATLGSGSSNAVATYKSSSGAYVAVSGGNTTSSGKLYGNVDTFLNATVNSEVTFVARYPGALGNSLGVYVVHPATQPTDTWAKQFDYVPTYNSNNSTVVVTTAAASASIGTTITIASSSFTVLNPMTTSLYAIGPSLISGTSGTAFGAALRISAFTLSGSNYVCTLATGSVSAITLNVNDKITICEPDEVHVAVVDIDGGISGTAGTILEKWQNLSLYTDGKRADGTNNYYRDYINRYSSYVYANNSLQNVFGPGADAASVPTNNNYIRLDTAGYGIGSPYTSYQFILGNSNTAQIAGTTTGNGFDGTVSSGDISTALDVFSDPTTIDVNLVFCGDTSGTTALSTAEQRVQSIANTRKDAVGFISAPVNLANYTSDTARRAAVLAKFNDQSATRDSYSVFDSTPLYVYNKYQDNYVWIPACGHMAGLCANTDTVADAWFSPAGYNRGNLKGVTKLAYNADQTSRDALYQASVNPIVSFPGQGILLYGDKTAQTKPSAFDRINVRRLFIVLEKAIATAAKYQLFELNDQFTQAMFRNMTEPFLRDIQGRRGITDFLVVCDSTNNTPQVVDSNQFVADIYIKPARSINFITLNFIATRTGVSFSEIAGTSNA